MPIRILDAQTVGRIAAGEVIERPASVVKELVENSLDAGATAVTVEIRDGGISYLRVTDNGCGIEKGQVRLAFENHATSKITDAQQLDDIRTLGFRGEALPSIAAVSRVEMTTRAKKQSCGVCLKLEAGTRVSTAETGNPEGTTVVVRDLFFNIPVRKTFLKKPQYEGALVSDAVSRMILGNPGVSFRFISNGRTIYHSYGDGDLRHAVFSIYGRETAEKMIQVDQYEGGMRISGLVGIGELAKATRGHEAFFINGRNVRCRLLSQALESACKERVTIGMYPMCILTLTIPPTSVDVNVHPNKLEVRFRDETHTRLFVESMLTNALNGGAMLDLKAEETQATVQPERSVVEIPAEALEKKNAKPEEADLKTEVLKNKTEVSKEKTEVDNDNGPFGAIRRLVDQERSRMRLDAQGAFALQETHTPFVAPTEPAEKKEPQEPCADEAVSPPKAPPQAVEIPLDLGQDTSRPAYRVIGVLFKTYILLECEDAMLLIDQHAAHERLRYDKMVKALEEGVASQRLLEPEIMRVTAREMALIEENMDALTAAGYDISSFGERDVQIRAVPFILGRADLRPRLMETIEALSSLRSAALEARREEILQKACKGAVKAGDALTDSEITSLLAQMEASGAPPTCPHGRPVIKTLSRREIERMFKRIQ